MIQLSVESKSVLNPIFKTEDFAISECLNSSSNDNYLCKYDNLTLTVYTSRNLIKPYNNSNSKICTQLKKHNSMMKEWSISSMSAFNL